MNDIQLKNATAEVLTLGWKDDSGERMTMTETTDCKKVMAELIPQLTKKDFFTKETTAVLAELGWVRDDAGEVTKTEFTPIPVEELDNTLLQDIDSCQKIRELKEIALSNPQFKKITGRLSSFDFDSLKLEMIRILDPTSIANVAKEPDVPTKLNQKLMDKPIQVAVENFEKEKIQVKDSLPPFEEMTNETVFPDDFVEPIPDEEFLIGRGMINIKDIIRKEPFSTLFDINPNTLNEIAVNMMNNGYDHAFPVILWRNTLVDGFTRIKASEQADIENIPYERKEFKDEHEALEYAMHNQRDRRNITEAELLRCISVIDTPMSKTEAGAKRGEKKTPTHKQTAKTLGIGESVVTDARTVLKDETAKEEVEAGKKTLREAAKEVRQRKRKPKETISEALTKIGSVIQVLKKSAGKDIKLAFLLKEANDLGVTEDVMSIVMEVLTAVNLVKVSEDRLIIKKALK